MKSKQYISPQHTTPDNFRLSFSSSATAENKKSCANFYRLLCAVVIILAISTLFLTFFGCAAVNNPSAPEISPAPMLYPMIDESGTQTSTVLVNEKWETAADIGTASFVYIGSTDYTGAVPEKIYALNVRAEDGCYTLRTDGSRITALDGTEIRPGGKSPSKVFFSYGDDTGNTMIGLYNFETEKTAAEPGKYSDIIEASDGSFLAKNESEGLFHIIDENGSTVRAILSSEWKELQNSSYTGNGTLSHDNDTVKDAEGKAVFTAGDGQVISGVFLDRFVYVYVTSGKNKLYGIYLTDGTELLVPEYDQVYFAFGCLHARKDGIAYVFSGNGRLIYQGAGSANASADGKFLRISTDTEYGYTDMNGKWVYKREKAPWIPLAAVRDDYLMNAEESSDEREEAITHIMLHFSSAVLTNPDDPFNVEAVRNIFINAGVSAHYIIDRDGTIYRLLPEERKAWHAGAGDWREDERYTDRMNQYSIGIELLAFGTQQEMSQYVTAGQYAKLDKSGIGYTDAQYASLDNLIEDIIHRNPGVTRDRQHIIGHDEYSRSKNDPGELFEWDRIILEVPA